MPALRQMSARLAAANIAADLIEPEMKTFRCDKAVQVLPGFQQRLLHHIFEGISGHAPQLRQAIQARASRCQPLPNFVQMRWRDIPGVKRDLSSSKILSSSRRDLLVCAHSSLI